jgi:hypothetical protein
MLIRNVPDEVVPVPSPEPPRLRTMEPPVTVYEVEPRVKLPPVKVRVHPSEYSALTWKVKVPAAVPVVEGLLTSEYCPTRPDIVKD